MTETRFSIARICSLLAFALLLNVAAAQDKIVPELDTLQNQYNAQVETAAMQPFKAAMQDLDRKYFAALGQAQATAQQAGKLEDALAIKREKDRMFGGPPVGKKIPDVLKQLNGTYRTSRAKIEQDRDKKIRPINEQFLKSLSALVTSLTKEGKLQDAMAVRKIQEKLSAQLGPSAADSAATKFSSAQQARNASKNKPFVNTLGMRFVPVTGTNFLFCIHVTRVKDYAVFARENPGVNEAWKTPKFSGGSISQDDDHPVVEVSWDDANAFCAWLGKQDGLRYGLPHDLDWSKAAGSFSVESVIVAATPEIRSAKCPELFPWGTQWPPPKGFGNYAGTSTKIQFPTLEVIEGYTDEFPATAPVMSFKPNKFGLYDMGGNVWEWCDDWYNNLKNERVMRGASWGNSVRGEIGLCNRAHGEQSLRACFNGFRCVIIAKP